MDVAYGSQKSANAKVFSTYILFIGHQMVIAVVPKRLRIFGSLWKNSFFFSPSNFVNLGNFVSELRVIHVGCNFTISPSPFFMYLFDLDFFLISRVQNGT